VVALSVCELSQRPGLAVGAFVGGKVGKFGKLVTDEGAVVVGDAVGETVGKLVGGASPQHMELHGPLKY